MMNYVELENRRLMRSLADGFTIKEIAFLYGITRKTVRWRIACGCVHAGIPNTPACIKLFFKELDAAPTMDDPAF